MAKKTKREKKISGKVDRLVMVLYALVIAAAVIRELLDRKEKKESEQ